MLTTNQSQSSSSSSSRVAKSSQRILTSSSSSEMKASSMKSDLRELQRGISEMKNNISTNFSQRLRSSMENLVDRWVPSEIPSSLVKQCQASSSTVKYRQKLSNTVILAVISFEVRFCFGSISNLCKVISRSPWRLGSLETASKSLSENAKRQISAQPSRIQGLFINPYSYFSIRRLLSKPFAPHKHRNRVFQVELALTATSVFQRRKRNRRGRLDGAAGDVPRPRHTASCHRDSDVNRRISFAAEFLELLEQSSQHEPADQYVEHFEHHEFACWTGDDEVRAEEDDQRLQDQGNVSPYLRAGFEEPRNVLC